MTAIFAEHGSALTMQMPCNNHSILIYSPNVFQSYGHNYDYVHGLAVALTKHDLQVHVLGWKGPLQLPAPTIMHQVERQLPSLSRSQLKGLGGLGDVIWGINRLLTERQLASAAYSIIKSAPEMYVLFETFEYLALQSLITKAPISGNYACIFHDTSFDASHSSRVASLYKGMMVKAPARSILTHAQTVYVHGERMRQNLLHTLGYSVESDVASKVHVLPYGAPHPDTIFTPDKYEARRRLGLPADEQILLAFGTLRRDKDYELMLNGLAKTDDWHLLFAGPEGDLAYADLRRQAAELGISGRITTHEHFVDANAQADFFAASDALACLYQEEVRHESGTAQRARSFLKPIIVSGAPDLVDYVNTEKVGWAVEPGSPDVLTYILHSISTSTEEQQIELRQKIYQCAVRRSWECVADLITQRLAAYR